MELRSNLPVGTSPWATRRAQWLSLGISDEDMAKPKIAIVNSSSDLASCFAHLDGIVGPLKETIRQAGGLPFEVRTAAPSDFITSVGKGGRYILPTRDLIAADIEVAVEGAQLDGMICLASCDKTVPGQLMAAARLNIPTLIVPCGYQPCGLFRGEKLDIEEVFLKAGHVASGKISLEELAEMSESAIKGPGVCAGMGTANSMHISCEALGMTLPGTTPVAANSEAMWDAVRRAGERIVAMIEENLRPRDVLTPDAFANAVTVMLALSGSINTMKHLKAVAAEAECDVDIWNLYETLGPKVPLVAAVRPNGDQRIEDLEAAGGTQAVMRQLSGLLRPNPLTVDGRTAGEIYEAATVRNPEVIRPADDPWANHPTIVVLRGSLAPGGSVVKLAVDDTRPRRFSGPARVYHSRDEGLEGLRNGEVQAGEVVLLAGIGLRGAPGMGLTSAFIFALDGAGLGDKCAVITDGQMSGLVNKGIVVGEVTPEAATGGPLGLVRDGDIITIDLERRTVDLEVPADELERRRAAFTPPPGSGEQGWLAVYERTVGALSDGAVLRG
ncbi:MAG TPA: dihydroxy-acid dehydratase [Trebonia sp.]|nr:dihydroxy-acid dehydratase [Trebonia sp.]